VVTLTLTCDHRAVDGARAARFLGALAGMVERRAGLM
jgi:pyruvate/2-oxoglutarate dehydrogenase complex dihydrolipoamide acyltransferase (E2) component